MFILLTGSKINAQTFQSGASMAQMQDFKEVLSSYLKSDVSDAQLINYMASSTENLNRIKDIKNTLNSHPKYDEQYLDHLINAMEEKIKPSTLPSPKNR